MYFQREISPHVAKLAGMFPVVMVTGPRQAGKSTLVREMFSSYEYVTMDDHSATAVAKVDPVGFLSGRKRPMVIDEVQKAPALFDAIKVVVDREKSMGRFILTGSNQPELFEKAGESLAGRIGIAELMPFSVSELKAAGVDVSCRDVTLQRGFMPRHFSDGVELEAMYSSYFRTYVERDVRKLVNVGDLDLFETFVQLLAGRVGQLVNKQSLARDVGVSERTIARWIAVLKTSYIVFSLRPYHANFGKRVTKADKIYFTDTGLVSYLLGIRSASDMSTHPLMGNVFENMVVAEAFKECYNAGRRPNLFFYRNSSGSVEVDLLREDGASLDAYEIKSAATFHETMLRGLRAFSELTPAVRRRTVVYAGQTTPPLAVNFTEVKSALGL